VLALLINITELCETELFSDWKGSALYLIINIIYSEFD